MKDVLLFIHIFSSIVWVGGLLFVAWGVYPASRLLPIFKQKNFLIQLMKKSHKGFITAGGLVLFTGFLMGITGPIHSLSQLVTTYYGKWWLLSFGVGLVTLGWGTFIGYRAMIRILSRDIIWKMAAKGYPRLLYISLFKVAVISSIEGLGFVILIILMVII